jgi:hypothetical protein
VQKAVGGTSKGVNLVEQVANLVGMVTSAGEEQEGLIEGLLEY